jgi:hypothetical protein
MNLLGLLGIGLLTLVIFPVAFDKNAMAANSLVTDPVDVTWNNSAGVGRIESSGSVSFDNNGDPTFYRLELFINRSPCGCVIGLREDLIALATTDDPTVDAVRFRWITPTHNVLFDNENPLLNGQAQDFCECAIAGDWRVEADFLNGIVIVETFVVRFTVLPESPIGTIAILGSSIGALGGYMLVRHRKNASLW